MGQAPRIAIDAMGGDTGPAVMLAGAARAHAKHGDLQFLMFGDKALVRAELDKHRGLKDAVEIVHCDDVIADAEKPSQAIRRAKTTSMGRAIAAVKAGQAQAALSAGNTGALMAMSKLALRTMPGIDRPALAALLPTLGESDLVMLDLGANTEADTQNLVQWAVMGAAYSRVALDLERPRVQLLNIGTEELKGTDALKDAAAILRETDYLGLRFDGFIEGDKIGFLISRPATELLRHHLDPNNHNGAVFLGLNGIVVKSHGSANAKGVGNAIGVAARMVREDLTRKIKDDLDNIAAHRAPVAAK